jgi:hypothetical protein
MSVVGGRGGRSDDWSSQHARARARTAERLDGPIDANEAAWLDGHLASCAECSAVAADYAAQRLQLRALRDRPPVPPRDLWARTAAAIESESRHRSIRSPRSRRSSLRPFAILAGALVVAIAVGTLTSSQWPFGDATTTPGTSAQVIAANSPTPEAVAPTPLAVGPQDVAYISVDDNGNFALNRTRVDEVCPSDATDCVSSKPLENSVPIGPLSSPQTVFGAVGKPLVIMGGDAQGSSVVVMLAPTQAPVAASEEPTETPDITPSDEPTGSPDESATPATSPPDTTTPPVATSTPTSTPTPTESVEPTESLEPTATPSEPAAEPVEIARDLDVVDTTAAYARDGSAFAFTAQPSDGSHGPDIYVWKVGEKDAKAVTTDHRSVFGSWSADGIVGSSVAFSEDGSAAAPSAIVVKGSGEPEELPAAGNAWRPAVDPKGSNAVYWTGTLAPDGAHGWKTDRGRLVIGRWGDIGTAPDATAPAASDQAQARNEKTIAEGPLTDWDARWDETGTRLAVWIADPGDPSVGKLSLYEVDPFDGSIDLANPPLHETPAMAGFSIADGRLAWATPDDGTAQGGRVLIQAWTADAFGQVESAPGDFLLVR